MSSTHIGNWEIATVLDSEVPPDVWRVKQVHGGKIGVAGDSGEADGIVTSANKQSIGIATADCMPAVIVTANQAVALHVSRKTIIKGLLDAVLVHINPADIVGVYIGPHICGDHFVFEFEGEDIKTFCQQYPTAARITDAGVSLTLREALQTYLDKWNVPAKSIVEDGRCTQEHEELPSYKRALARGKPLAGQLVTFVRTYVK